VARKRKRAPTLRTAHHERLSACGCAAIRIRAGELAKDGALLPGKPVVRKVRRVQGVAPRPCLGGLMFGHTCLRRDRRLAEGGCCDV
jgi:hypothetical protein